MRGLAQTTIGKDHCFTVSSAWTPLETVVVSSEKDNMESRLMPVTVCEESCKSATANLLQLQELRAVSMQIQRRVDGTDHEGHLHVSVTPHVGALQVQPALKTSTNTAQYLVSFETHASSVFRRNG